MPDPGFIPGFIGYAIQLAGNHIIHHINVAVRCRKELDALRDLLTRIYEMNLELQKYQKALNSGKLSTFSLPALPSTVNSWLKKLSDLLEEASDLTECCTVPSHFHLFSRYSLSRKIRKLAAKLKKHVEKDVATVAFLHQLHQDVAYRHGFEQMGQRIDSIQRTGMPAPGDLLTISTSSTASYTRYIEEAVIVGQDSASSRLEELIDSDHHNNLSRFGIVGKGGSGKTLLLKRIFNSDQVQTLFSNDLMIWVTVSQNPSFNAIRRDMVKQIALTVKEVLDSTEEYHVKNWLNETMAKRKFALFLDDVWEMNATSLLEELCVPLFNPQKSNIIVATSRTTSVLSRLGVPKSSLIQMRDLTEDDSWNLFCFHAFPHSGGILPRIIDEDVARGVCKECGGLPLALKVIGHAMAGITQPSEWEFTLQKLQNDGTQSLSCTLPRRLRLSYDALADVAGYGISLQLCFLSLAAFSEDEVISIGVATKYWIGEGLAAGTNPIQIGERYVKILADRCLVEPVHRDCDGNVVYFKVHDVLYDMAHQIAEYDEKCFLRAGRGLSEFPREFSGNGRISLWYNNLTSIPKTFRAPCIRSLLLAHNLSLTKIPKEVFRSMTALRVLDLSFTGIRSLPKSIGCLKHLACLKLSLVPIKRLPNTISALKNLQILDLYKSDIRELPSTISKLTSLKLLKVNLCKHLLCMPDGISRLTSLEYLNTSSSNIRWKNCGKGRLSINNLGTLTQLKRLALQNNGEIIREGMLGNMKEMKWLCLSLTDMENLPHDMSAMTKLNKLWLECPKFLKIEYSFSQFQHLSYIGLSNCHMLKQLPALHEVQNLRHLQIVNCPNIKRFPEDFGKEGTFPKLEIFSVVEMKKLEQLPMVEGGALPSLKKLTLMKCEALQSLPQCYWNLESVEKIRVYGCSKVFHVMTADDNFIKSKTKVQTIRLSTAETQELEKRYHHVAGWTGSFYHVEFGYNETFHFLDEVYGHYLF